MIEQTEKRRQSAPSMSVIVDGETKTDPGFADEQTDGSGIFITLDTGEITHAEQVKPPRLSNRDTLRGVGEDARTTQRGSPRFRSRCQATYPGLVPRRRSTRRSPAARRPDRDHRRRPRRGPRPCCLSRRRSRRRHRADRSRGSVRSSPSRSPRRPSRRRPRFVDLRSRPRRGRRDRVSRRRHPGRSPDRHRCTSRHRRRPRRDSKRRRRPSSHHRCRRPNRPRLRCFNHPVAPGRSSEPWRRLRSPPSRSWAPDRDLGAGRTTRPWRTTPRSRYRPSTSRRCPPRRSVRRSATSPRTPSASEPSVGIANR